MKAPVIEIYQTWEESGGMADCRWHGDKESRDKDLLDLDNVGHDSWTAFKIELSLNGIVYFLNQGN